MAIEHKDIPDVNLHQTKGAATATLGQVLTAVGDGTATFQTPPYSLVKVGWYDYSDTLTAGTPIALTLANTYYDLTNNGLGVNTNISYGLSGVTNVWNTGINRFDFSGLVLGNTVDLRVDLTITTSSVNTAVKVDLELGVGTGSAFYLPIIPLTNYKSAGTYRVVGTVPFYLANNTIKNNPARVRAQADGTGATVVVNNWFARVIKNA